MTNIAIRDLEINEELDREAMKHLTGGWFWGMSQSTSMGWGYGPLGGGGWYSNSTSMGWGTGFGGFFPPMGWGPYVTYPGNIVY